MDALTAYTLGHDYAEGIEIGSGEVPPADPAMPIYDAGWDDYYAADWARGYEDYRARSLAILEGTPERWALFGNHGAYRMPASPEFATRAEALAYKNVWMSDNAYIVALPL